MRHFIELRINRFGYSDAEYYYNDELNKIGDFSTYYYSNTGNTNNSWYKYRKYRGRFVHSKKAHCETSAGRKAWCYNIVWYDSYESYLLAIIG